MTKFVIMHSACVTRLLDLSAFGEFTNESTDWFELRNLQWRASLSRCVSWCRTYRCVWWRSRSDTPCSTQTAHPSKTLRWKAMSLSSFPNISDPPCFVLEWLLCSHPWRKSLVWPAKQTSTRKMADWEAPMYRDAWLGNSNGLANHSMAYIAALGKPPKCLNMRCCDALNKGRPAKATGALQLIIRQNFEKSKILKNRNMLKARHKLYFGLKNRKNYA